MRRSWQQRIYQAAAAAAAAVRIFSFSFSKKSAHAIGQSTGNCRRVSKQLWKIFIIADNKMNDLLPTALAFKRIT